MLAMLKARASDMAGTVQNIVQYTNPFGGAQNQTNATSFLHAMAETIVLD